MLKTAKANPGGVLVVKETLLRTLVASTFEAWNHPSPEIEAHIICIENLQFCADLLLLVDVHVHMGERVRVPSALASLACPSSRLT